MRPETAPSIRIVPKLLLSTCGAALPKIVPRTRCAPGFGAKLTLYTSTNDLALWVSKQLRGSGRAGGVPIIVSNVETIDISKLGGSLWSTNHNVYASNPLLFGDLSRLIAFGERPPDKRTSNFEAVTAEEGTYWRYKPPAK